MGNKNDRRERRPINFFGLILVLWILPQVFGWNGLSTFFGVVFFIAVIIGVVLVFSAVISYLKSQNEDRSLHSSQNQENKNPYSQHQTWSSRGQGRANQTDQSTRPQTGPSAPFNQGAQDVVYTEVKNADASAAPSFTYTEPLGEASPEKGTGPEKAEPVRTPAQPKTKLTENKYFKLVVTDALLALAAYILFSPHAIALTVGGGSVFRSVICILFALAIIGTLVYTNIKFLYTPKARILGDEEEKDLSGVLQGCGRKKVVGPYADTLLRQLQRGQVKKNNLYQLLQLKFDPRSLTYAKFSGVVDESLDTLKKNGLEIANQIQTFDAEEYLRLNEGIQSGSYHSDAVSDDLQEKHLALYQQRLEQIQKGLDGNERLLMKLDEFTGEMTKLTAGQVDKKNDEMIEEMEELIRTTKYYQ